MPGTITFRPIEANLTHNTDLLGKMNPYCAFIVGDSIFKGQICKHGGKHPHWEDAVTIPVGNQSQVIVELMDKDRFSRDDNIGSFLINLNELSQSGQSSRWYPLTYKNKPAGEILLEASFTGGLGQSGLQQGGYQQSGYQQSNLAGAGLVGASGYNETSTLNKGFIEGQSTTQQNVVLREEVIVEQPVILEQEVIRETVVPQPRNLFTEQSQVIEPRTFLKEVDVVETRAHLETIEVLEPHRVMKDVQYTQAVPVTKQIEINEPRVVMKEVEVMEPRLVTKTIQVIENVPVKKQVEVIESVPRLQEVQTFEPQTFTKQVEVTDYIPVAHQVTVTEPVHLKKQVEFVEPVITTKTITKEIAQPVIIDEKITTTVGPASIIAESETYITHFERLGISSNERLLRFNEWKRLRGEGYDDRRLEEHFTTKGWGPVNQYHFHNWSNHQGQWGNWNYGGSPYSSQYGSQQGSQQYGNHFSNLGLGISNDEGLNRYHEWHRLRNEGYDDSRLDKHFNTKGWGSVNQYRFNDFHNTYGNQLGSQYGSQYGSQLGGSQLGSQYGVQQGSQYVTQQGSQYGNHFNNLGLGISNDEGLNRYYEWNRLRNEGYDDSRLDKHFNTQGWGSVNQYRFNDFHNTYGNQLGSQYGSQYGSQLGGSQLHGTHHSSNPLGQKY